MTQFKNIKTAKSYTVFYHHYKIKQYKARTIFLSSYGSMIERLGELEMLLEQEPLAECF